MLPNPRDNTPPEVTDQILCSEIERFSEQENDFWSSIRRDPREFAHSLFQYPAMMVPIVQKKLIEVILQVKPAISTMLDPFVGAGTTITAAMNCGLDCYGQDINPLAILVSKAKTDFGWTDQELHRAYSQVVEAANTDNNTHIEVNFTNMSKWFQPEVSVALSKIRRAIMQQEDIRLRRILWVTLAETIRLTSNDRTTTYKLHARPTTEIQTRVLAPIDTFRELANLSITDISRFKNTLIQASLANENGYRRQIELVLGNTTQMVPHPNNVRDRGFDLLVTSPPYGDNTSTIPYGQNSYLPLQWIQLTDIAPTAEDDFLRTTQEIDRRSLGGATPENLNDLVEELSDQSPTLARVFGNFRETNQLRDRFVRVASFYRDFIIALDHILASLADNSYMVWTIGNRQVGGQEIPNDQILAELLSTRNVIDVTGINRNIYNKRMPHKNPIAQMMGSEKILVFRKLPARRVNNE